MNGAESQGEIMMNVMGLAETITYLRKKGYTEDFNLPNDRSAQSNRDVLSGDEFVVDQVFRFDVLSDPGDQSVLYAIHSVKTGKKGILVNGFGVYSESLTNQKLATIHRWET
jgi:hypothetical protein